MGTEKNYLSMYLVCVLDICTYIIIEYKHSYFCSRFNNPVG